MDSAMAQPSVHVSRIPAEVGFSHVEVLTLGENPACSSSSDLYGPSEIREHEIDHRRARSTACRGIRPVVLGCRQRQTRIRLTGFAR